MPKNKMGTYWFGIKTEGSVFEGEEFFVEKPNANEARDYAKRLFPNEEIAFYGKVSEYFAECMGLDTY